MRKKVVGTILIGMLIMSACSFPNSKETEQNSIVASSEEASETFTIDDKNSTNDFSAQMPVHTGVWQAADYGETKYFYEFSQEFSGRRVSAFEGTVEDFSYELTSGDNLVIHYADRDEYAHYSFGEDGKHLVLTYQDYQQNLQWMSHGTLEDIGGLGLSFIADNVTPQGCTLSYMQKGGFVTGEIVFDKSFQLIVFSDDSWGFSDWFGEDEQYFSIEKDSHGELSLDWTETGVVLEPGTYVLRFGIRDVRNTGGDWDSFDYRVWFTVPEDEDNGIELDTSTIIEDQSFDIQLNEWGNVRFVSCRPDKDKSPNADASFYLMDHEQVIYKMPSVYENDIRDWELFEDISFVAFKDINEDKKDEIIVGIQYITGVGPQGMIPLTEVRIFEDKGDSFEYSKELSKYVTDNVPEDGTIQDVYNIIME